MTDTRLERRFGPSYPSKRETFKYQLKCRISRDNKKFFRRSVERDLRHEGLY